MSRQVKPQSLIQSVSIDFHCSSVLYCGQVCRIVKCLCKLVPLVVVVAQSHHSEGAACDLLVEKEHESSSQHRLQQLRFKAFKKTQHTILPTEENQHENIKEQEVKEQNY